MTTQAQQQLWDRIMKRAEARLAKNTEQIRKTVERRLGQIYIFDRDYLTKTVQTLLTGQPGKSRQNLAKLSATKDFVTKFKLSTDPEWKRLLDFLEVEAKKREDEAFKGVSAKTKVSGTSITKRQEHIKRILMGGGQLGKLPLRTGQSAYLFKNHEYAVEFHREITRHVQLWVHKNIIEPLKGKGSEAAKEAIGKQFSQRFLDVGHGANIGASVAALKSLGEIKGAIRSAEVTGLSTPQAEELQKVYDRALDKFTKLGLSEDPVIAKIEQQYTMEALRNFYLTYRGTFKGDYISVISLQSSWDNNIDSFEEKRIINEVREEIAKVYVNTPGSMKPIDAFTSILTYSLMHGIKGAKSTVKPLKEYKHSTKVKGKYGATANISSGRKSRGQPIKTTIPNLVRERQTGINPLNLLAYINARLTKKVTENMGEPALVNRTGRFARSVIATDILQTRQGFPSVGYTYQKDPYQTFEIGAGRPPWATPQRDPRPLIDKSIREIAAEVFIGRLYTRRV